VLEERVFQNTDRDDFPFLFEEMCVAAIHCAPDELGAPIFIDSPANANIALISSRFALRVVRFGTII
jgi:hypothetical protein